MTSVNAVGLRHEWWKIGKTIYSEFWNMQGFSFSMLLNKLRVCGYHIKMLKRRPGGGVRASPCTHEAPALPPAPYTIRCALVHSCHLSTQTVGAGKAQGHPRPHSMLKASLSVTRPLHKRCYRKVLGVSLVPKSFYCLRVAIYIWVCLYFLIDISVVLKLYILK